MDPAEQPWVVAALTGTVVAWASAFVAIRGVGPYFSGGALALARLAVGTVLLRLALIGRPWVRPTPREWLLIGCYGAAWFGCYNVALNIAEHSLDAGTTAMIVNIGPILIALGAGWFLREGISATLATGAALAFVGVVLIGLGGGAGFAGKGAGILWCLLAAVAYSAGVLCQKAALRRIPGGQVTWMGCLIGLVCCLPFARQLLPELRLAPVGAILAVIYLGAVPTALAFSLWSYALSRLPASQVGIVTYVVPPLVILLGLLIFGESPTALAVVGGVVCLMGVAWSRRGPLPRKRAT